MKLIVILALLTPAACQRPGSAVPISNAEAERIATAVEADYGSGDTGKIMRHYAPYAVALDAGQEAPTNDPRLLRQWTGTFVSEKPADFQVSDRHIQVLDGDTFVSSGIAHYSVAAGAARPTVSVRFSQVYERQRDGSWKIANEHFSLPPTATATP